MAPKGKKRTRENTDTDITGVSIDVGTNNCSAAVYNEKLTRAVDVLGPNFQPTFPSTAAYDCETEKWTVGEYSPGDTPRGAMLVYEWKRFIGRNGQDGTLVEDIRGSQGRWWLVLSGRVNNPEATKVQISSGNPADSTAQNGAPEVVPAAEGDAINVAIEKEREGRNPGATSRPDDTEDEVDEGLEGVLFERMLKRARQVLLPAADGGHQADGDANIPDSPYFSCADDERQATDTAVTRFFRLVIDRYGQTDIRDPMSAAFDELAKATKGIYSGDLDIPDPETLILEYFGVMPVAIVGSHAVLPIELAAAVLRKAHDNLLNAYPRVNFASPSTGDAGVTPVITVPAYFTSLQRHDMMMAADFAGLRGAKLVNEPSAAAIGYLKDEGNECPREGIIVVDSGDGTTDLSCVTMQQEITGSGRAGSIASVIATDGDNRLGGLDFTRVVEKELCQQLGADAATLLDNARQTGELVKKAKEAKEHLNPRQPYKFRLAGTDVQICAEQFQASAKPLYERFERLVKGFIAEVQVGPRTKGSKQRGQCVLVGGGSLTHGLKELLEDILSPLGVEVCMASNPRTVVARGGAWMSSGRVAVNESTARDLGIAADNFGTTSPAGQTPMKVILPRNSPYGISREERFTNNEPDMSSMVFPLYEGDHPIAQRNILRSQWELQGLTHGPKGTQDIVVSIQTDNNGEPKPTAREILGDKKVVLVVKEKLFFTTRQYSRMRKNASERFWTDDNGQPEEAPQKRKRV